jgi:hypothetical protein
MSRRRLTDVLKEMGLIDEKQISMALQRQHTIGARVGTQLVHLGFINEDQLAEALSRLYRLPPLTTEMVHQIGADVRKSVPRELVEKYNILPVKKVKKRLTIAMTNPGDIELLQELEFRLASKIDVLVCPEMTMEFALGLHYGIEAKKEFVTLTDEKGRIELQQRAKAMLKKREALPSGFKEVKTYLEDNFLANVAYRSRLALNPSEAVSCALEAGEEIVNKVELYLIDPPTRILKKWKKGDFSLDDGPSELDIRFPEGSQLMQQLQKEHFFFGDKAALEDKQVVNRLVSLYAEKIMLIPIAVRGEVRALIYADNGMREMNPAHLESLLTLSSLIAVILKVGSLLEGRKQNGKIGTETQYVQPRRVRLTKVSSEGVPQPGTKTVVGREEAPPAVSEIYRVLTETGTMFSTSPTVEVDPDRIKTRNSIYRIDVLEEKENSEEME